MPSPFPGMDPYLEHPALWPDVHQALASQIRALLVPLIRPRYVARLATRYVADEPELGEIQVLYPDVDVSAAKQPLRETRTALASGASQSGSASQAPSIPPAPLVLAAAPADAVKLISVEVHDRDGNRLVTAIEILSPVNKRRGQEGWLEYRRRREAILAGGANLVEIDLLRRGEPPARLIGLPEASYFVFLTRAQRVGQSEVWPLSVRDSLPVIPVPLQEGDADVALDLGRALRDAYDEAGYELSIDYGQPPVPPLPADDTAWARDLLARASVGGS